MIWIKNKNEYYNEKNLNEENKIKYWYICNKG